MPRFALLLTLASVLLAGAAHAEDVADDPMLPTSDPADAIVSPLRVVTLTTADVERTRRFLQGAIDMNPISFRLDGDEAGALAAHWHLAADEPLEITVFHRAALDDEIMVRVIAAAEDTPAMRPDYDSRYFGALGFGFPSSDLDTTDAIVRAFGFDPVAKSGIVRMDFPRADGTTYNVGESHYRIPGNALVLGVDRDDMQPVSRIDPVLGVGGPAYSSMIVDDSAAFAGFFTGVLGYERRREFTFESPGPDGGMRLAKGDRVRFQQWFTPGARSGYLVVMELLDDEREPPVPLGPRHQGIGMWSFETGDLDVIERRAAAHGATVRSAAREIDAPGLGPVRSLVLETPDGFPIEVFERLTTEAAGQ